MARGKGVGLLTLRWFVRTPTSIIASRAANQPEASGYLTRTTEGRNHYIVHGEVDQGDRSAQVAHAQSYENRPEFTVVRSARAPCARPHVAPRQVAVAQALVEAGQVLVQPEHVRARKVDGLAAGADERQLNRGWQSVRAGRRAAPDRVS